MKNLRFIAPFLLCNSLFAQSSQFSLVNIAHTNNGGTATAVTISGNYAYLAAEGGGLLVYDISNPAHPVNVGSSPTNIANVVVFGAHAYGSQINHGSAYAFDISNPAAPTCIATLTNNVFGGLAISGTNLFIGGDGRTPTFSLTNPVSPVLLTNYLTGGNATGFAVSSNYLVSIGDSVLTIGTLSNGVFSNVANTNLAINILGVAISGQNLFLANKTTNSFQTWSISASNTLTKIAQLAYPATNSFGFNALTLSGNFAYFANGLGINVVNISDPTHPVTIGQPTSSFGGTPYAVAISGHYVFLANGSDGLRVFSIQPQVTAAKTTENGLAFTWPAQGSFILQQNSNLTGGTWTTVTNIPVTNGPNAQINLPQPSTNTFYRLMSQ